MMKLNWVWGSIGPSLEELKYRHGFARFAHWMMPFCLHLVVKTYWDFCLLYSKEKLKIWVEKLEKPVAH